MDKPMRSPKNKQKKKTTSGGEGGNQAEVLKAIGDTVNAYVVRKPPQNTGGSKPGGAGGGVFQIMPVWKIEFVDPHKRTKEKLMEKIEDILERFYHDEQYEMEEAVEVILALLTSEVEMVKKEMAHIKLGELYKYYKKEQRKALSELKGGEGK